MSLDNKNKSAAEHLADKLRTWTQEQNAQTKIPSIRQIAEDYDTSVTTAMYALRVLENEGVIKRRPRGSAVVAGEKEQLTKPNPQAAVSNNKPKQIAVSGPIGPRSEYAWKDQWGIRIRQAAEEYILDKSKYSLSRVGVYGPDWPEAMQQIGEQIVSLADNLAGVIIPGANNKHHPHLFEVCEKLNLPWVSINRPKYNRTSNFVALDYQLCGQVAGLAFQELEAKRVLIITRDISSTSDSEKTFGVFQSYWSAGKQTDHIHTMSAGGIQEVDGYKALQEYLVNNPAPDCVFVTGDLLAIGAIKFCQKQGLSAPDDIKVLSSTGLDVSEYTDPPLATISQPMRQMGQRAAAMLLKMIETGRRQIPGQMIAPTLIPRQSLGLSEPQAQKIADKLDIVIGQADVPTDTLDDQLPNINATTSQDLTSRDHEGAEIAAAQSPLDQKEDPQASNPNYNPPALDCAVGSTPLITQREYSADTFTNPLKQENSHDTHA